LTENEALLGISNGVASVKSAHSIRTFDISQRANLKAQDDSDKVSKVATVSLDSKSVLQMSIDPAKITVDDLDRYERMM